MNIGGALNYHLHAYSYYLQLLEYPFLKAKHIALLYCLLYKSI